MSKDRYVGNRINLNTEESNYWLQHKRPKELFKSYLEKTPIAVQDIQFLRKLNYIKSLSKVLNIEENSQIVPCNNTYHNTDNVAQEQQWPVTPRSRPISKPQLAVLDLPRIKNDITYNVVHWASSDLITAALANTIYLWHVNTCKIFQIIHRSNNITALRLDASGYFLAYSQESSGGKCISIWDVKRSKDLVSRSGTSHNYDCYITSIDWRKDNKFIAAGFSNGSLYIFSSSLETISYVRKAHGDKPVLRVKFSPWGDHLATTGQNSKIIIWTVPHLQIIHVKKEIDDCCRGLSWHPFRRSYLCYATFGGKLALMNTSLGKNLYETEHKDSVYYDLTFNNKTAEVVVSSTFLDLQPAGYYQHHPQINVLARLNHVVDRFIGHNGRVLYLEWSPDAETLATIGSDETIYLWKFLETSKTRLKEKSICFKSFNFI